jgi:hypothetical protein
MKIMKIMNNTSDNTKRKALALFVLLITVGIIYAQGTHPGTDEGLPTPVDGGILMALLAGGGLLAMTLKKKKKKDI